MSPAFPMLVLGAVLAVLAYRTRASWYCLASAAAFIVGCIVAFRHTVFVAAYGVVPFHLFFFAVLAVGALCKDRFARFLQHAAALLLPFLFFGALFCREALVPELPGVVLIPYLALLLGISAVGILCLGNDWYLYGGLINVVLLGANMPLCGYRWVNGTSLAQYLEMRGLAFMGWGGVSFAIALTISLWKGGVIQRYTRDMHTLLHDTHGRLYAPGG